MFVAWTLVFLTGYRYAGGTAFIDWYLFQLARQTSAVLAWVGRSCEVEPTASYRGQEAMVRAKTAAWSGRPPEQGGGPLTPWEVWRYRALKSRHDAAAAAERLRKLTASPSTLPVDLNEKARLLEEIGRLEETMVGSADELSQTQAQAALMPLKAALAESHPTATNESARLERVRGELQRLIEQAASDAQRQALVLAAQARNEGPLVAYVPRSNGANGSPEFQFKVVADCGGIPSMSIYLAALLAFPTTWRKRALGALAGLPFLYGANILRLACLGMVGARWGTGPWFDFTHHYVWQGLYLVLVVAAWLAWVERLARRKTVKPEALP